MKHLPSLITMTLILLSGCGQKESKPSCSTQSLTLNMLSEPQTLNPTRARALADINVIKMVGEGLMRLDKQGTPQPALATSVDISSDAMTYTFTLRDAKWSNGQPVTSDDFIYAWKMSLRPDYPSDNAYLLYTIKHAQQIKKGRLPSSLLGVEAPDAHHLIIRLSRPTPYFLELLAHPIYFPLPKQIAAQDPHWADRGESYVGCGPFTIETWNHNDTITLAKNHLYWDQSAVKLDTVTLSMVPEETGLKLFEMKELDCEGSPFSTLPTDALPALQSSGRLQMEPLCGTCWMRLNVDRTPLSSPSIRKALALAINREEILTHVTHNTLMPAPGIVPGSLNLHPSPLMGDGNKEEAKRLFTQGCKELGLKPKKFPPISLVYAMTDRNHKIAQAIQGQWKETLGVDITLSQVESKVAFSLISHQEYDIALGNWIADVNDPISFLEVFASKTNGTNNTGWESPEYASLLTRSFFAASSEERFDLLRQSEQILMEEMPVIPIYTFTMCYIQSPDVEDIAVSKLGSIDIKSARRVR